MNEENDVYPPKSKDVYATDREDIENSPGAIRGQGERMIMNESYRPIPESPAVSRLKDLIGLTRTAKSFNSCFGNRIERIGSWSGLGCNNVNTGGLPVFDGCFVFRAVPTKTNQHNETTLNDNNSISNSHAFVAKTYA